MRQLSTLLLSLLLCATCLAQPDSRPGPYQATLAKINALLVGGAATVKEIEFTVDGSALASSSKTQAYSDGNAGSLFVRVPTAKMVQGLVNSSILLNLGRAFNTVADTNWAIGAFGTGANTGTNSASGIGAVGTATYYNQATGGSHQFSTNGVNCVSFTDSAQRFYTAGTESAHFDSSGLTTNKNIYFNGAGSASSTLTTMWTDAANGNWYMNVPSAKTFTVRVAGSNLYTFSTGLVLADAVNVVPGSTTGTKFGTATTNKMGFWNATPVIQPALTGTSTTLTTAGSTNALYADSTSTGGIGSTAYSLPDVVRNLKTAGLLAP